MLNEIQSVRIAFVVTVSFVTLDKIFIAASIKVPKELCNTVILDSLCLLIFLTATAKTKKQNQ